MSDTLLWGSARPRIRVGTSSQVNGTNYVLNQPAAEFDIDFPKQIVLNESSLTGYLNEHLIGHRGIFVYDFEMLDRASCERLIDIFNSSTDKYMRPCFNFYKEYQVRVVNAWELDKMGKSNQPYKGTLQFETISLESTIPSESSGSYNFNGLTKVTNTLASTLAGNCVVELWIKTPSAFNVEEELFSMTGTVSWTVSITTAGKIKFVTDDGTADTLTTTNALSTSTWYFIQVNRVSTDNKIVYVDGTSWGDQNDSKAANSITATQLAETTNGFSGYCQIYRIYNANFSGTTQYSEHSIEAINSSYLGNIKLWWDFSQGSETDLSAEENDGTTTGTEQYYEESFTDTREEALT